MGDRVAVLRFGKLQQFASPNELYDKPANAFVAGFIGSPAMNLVTLPDHRGRRQDRRLDTGTRARPADQAERGRACRRSRSVSGPSNSTSPIPVAWRSSSTWSRTSAARRTCTPMRAPASRLVARCNPRTAPKLADTVRLRRHPEGRGAPVPSARPASASTEQMRAPEFRLRAPTPGLVGVAVGPAAVGVDGPRRSVARHRRGAQPPPGEVRRRRRPAVGGQGHAAAGGHQGVRRAAAGSRRWGCPRCVRRAWCCNPSSTPRSWSPATSRGPGSTAGCSCVCRRTSRSTGRACWTRWRACWWNCIATVSSGATVHWRTPCSPATGSFLQAWLVDAETSEVHPTLSRGQRRHDLEILVENVAKGMVDLAERLGRPEEMHDTLIAEAEQVQVRYDTLWERPARRAGVRVQRSLPRRRDHPAPQRTRLRRRRTVAATGQRGPEPAQTPCRRW